MINSKGAASGCGCNDGYIITSLRWNRWTKKKEPKKDGGNFKFPCRRCRAPKD